MFEILILSLVAVCLVSAIVRISFKVMKNRAERQRRNEKWEKEMDEYRTRAREERLEWNRKVNHAKRHLIGAKDWMDPKGKEEFVKELFEGGVPQYLWYGFDKITADETRQIVDFCWGGKCDFGDLEGHRMLRIRNAKKFSALLLGKLPLEQIGHCNGWDTIDEDGFPTGTVLFSADGFYPSAAAA